MPREPTDAGTDPAADYGFRLERAPSGWRWQAFDLLGRVAAEGVAPSKPAAAACLIDALARA